MYYSLEVPNTEYPTRNTNTENYNMKNKITNAIEDVLPQANKPLPIKQVFIFDTNKSYPLAGLS